MSPLVVLRHPYKGQPIELMWWSGDTTDGQAMASATISPLFAIALAQDLLQAAYTEMHPDWKEVEPDA